MSTEPKYTLSDYEMRVLSVRCTLCNAAPQSNCRDEREHEMRPHVARMDAYERARTRAEGGAA